MDIVKILLRRTEVYAHVFVDKRFYVVRNYRTRMGRLRALVSSSIFCRTHTIARIGPYINEFYCTRVR